MLLHIQLLLASSTLLAFPTFVYPRALSASLPPKRINELYTDVSSHLEVGDELTTTIGASISSDTDYDLLEGTWGDLGHGLLRRAKSPSSASSPNTPDTNSPASSNSQPQDPGQPGSPLILSDSSKPEVSPASTPGAPLILPDSTKPDSESPSEATPGAPLVLPSAPASVGEDAVPKCKRTARGVLARTPGCEPEGSDRNTEESGLRSDPQPQTGAGRVNPNDWYEKIDAGLRFDKARDEFERRRATDEADVPFRSMDDRYEMEKSREIDLFTVDEEADELKLLFDEIDPAISGKKGFATLVSSLIDAETDVGNTQENEFSTDGEVIVSDVSYAKRDGNPPGSRNRYNELLPEQYQKVAGGNTSKLKYIARHEITNAATRQTMRTAIKRVYGLEDSAEIQGRLFTFRRDAQEGSEEQKAFDALSWSDNVNGIWWMLAQSYQALGRKQIAAIYVKMDDEQESANLVLEMGPV